MDEELWNGFAKAFASERAIARVKPLLLLIEGFEAARDDQLDNWEQRTGLSLREERMIPEVALLIAMFLIADGRREEALKWVDTALQGFEYHDGKKH